MAANLYNTNNCSPSCPQEPDEISLFLQQIILRSSSNMHRYSLAEDQEPERLMVPGPGRIFEPEMASGLNVSLDNNNNNNNNEENEYDYESEEIAEAIVEESAPKPTQSRSCSKRSRAAEVHNLSEKRRRSRINEKMKALQNLIPNSNEVKTKTDKASMLDEAIEYLKQLQLQVQMLTMRNGLSLYPICLPGMVQSDQMSQSVYEMDKISNVSMTKLISMDQNISADALVRLQDKHVKQAPVNDHFSSVIRSKASFEMTSLQGHFGTYNCSRSSKLEKVLPCQPINDDRPETSLTGAEATTSIPCETNVSNLKENTIEACLAGGDHLLHSLINDPIFSSQFEYVTSSNERS